ncbi:unnamed protein product [Amoebophrya sp. A25]|nr:unnamed protein product [Amoebophrya sp. A25]|eukprot:GSA25T00008122001.1
MMQSKMPGAELLNTKLCVIDHINVIGPHVLDLLKKHVADPLLTILYPQVAQNTTYHGDLLHYNPARSDRVDGVNYASSGMAADDDDLYGTPPSSPCEAGNSLRNDDLAPTDYRYGFSIGYANANRDKANGSRNISRVGLDCHTDDSEVSLTIRLGREYEGGEVGLRWKIGDKFEGEEQCLIKQKNGEGTLFYGQQFHEVHPVTSGERQMLVVWFRGEKTFRANTCPCCRMHRRHDTNCVLCFDARIKGTRSRSGSQDACELDESARGPTLDEKLRRSATQ